MVNPRRRALTLVELLCSAVLLLGFLGMLWSFFRSSRRNIESTERKVDASFRTHVRLERLRHDLETAPHVWVAPGDREDALGGGHYLLAGAREVLFEPDSGTLVVGGRDVPGEFEDARFYGQDGFLVKVAITADHSRPSNTGRPGFRERSTLVTKVFLENQAEESRERNHVWEDEHPWCVGGDSLHLGVIE